MGSNHDPKAIPNPISSRRAARAQPGTREGSCAPPFGFADYMRNDIGDLRIDSQSNSKTALTN